MPGPPGQGVHPSRFSSIPQGFPARTFTHSLGHSRSRIKAQLHFFLFCDRNKLSTFPSFFFSFVREEDQTERERERERKQVKEVHPPLLVGVCALQYPDSLMNHSSSFLSSFLPSFLPSLPRSLCWGIHPFILESPLTLSSPVLVWRRPSSCLSFCTR